MPVASPLDRVRHGTWAGRPSRQAVVGRRSRRRLHGHHAAARGEDLPDDAGAGRPGPAADGHVDGLEVRIPLQQLEIDRRVAVDDGRLVARVDVAQPALTGEPLRLLDRLVHGRAVHHDLTAEGAHRGDLAGRRRLRHDDDRGRPDQPGAVADRLGVVPGRRRDQPRLSLVGVQAEREVDAAAHLERPRRLDVLVLHHDRHAGGLVEQRVRPGGGRRQVRGDGLGGASTPS